MNRERLIQATREAVGTGALAGGVLLVSETVQSSLPVLEKGLVFGLGVVIFERGLKIVKKGGSSR